MAEMTAIMSSFISLRFFQVSLPFPISPWRRKGHSHTLLAAMNCYYLSRCHLATNIRDLKIPVPSDPKNSLLGNYPREIRMCVKQFYKQVFTAALLRTEKSLWTWKTRFSINSFSNDRGRIQVRLAQERQMDTSNYPFSIMADKVTGLQYFNLKPRVASESFITEVYNQPHTICWPTNCTFTIQKHHLKLDPKERDVLHQLFFFRVQHSTVQNTIRVT